MSRRSARAIVAMLACVVSGALLSTSQAMHAQERVPESIVERLVATTCDKRVVLLGELPSHGEAHAFDVKARLVDRLIAQCGFTAVLFEAPMYDFVGLARAIEARTATPEQLDEAIGRFWWTRELGTWRRSLFDAATARRVTLGGLDDQVSITSRYARATLPGLVASASPEPRAAECREVVDRHLRWTYDAAHPFDEAEKQRLQQCSRNAADTATSRGAFDASDRAMLESFARYAARQRSDGTTGRDASMFRALEWHLTRLPANSRVVVWTATVHAAKQRGTWPEPPLGALAVERWGDRVAAIGFTAAAGASAMAGRPARPLAAAPPESLEATATRDTPWALLDAPALRRLGSVPSRLLGAVGSDTWADSFDAVVVIGQEVAPTFDPWK
ncbi:erythromycin esterase family protein [Luteitalea sp. TBR-22]|uniref:erythromycin esterase family protein n=1 Tax=Luteitalea sp. TBR-22 TaxID=2802971 RepID=UPI001EF44BC7|nr:erythromycin esterase family protein [Luteitalea sp. TBR-22]